MVAFTLHQDGCIYLVSRWLHLPCIQMVAMTTMSVVLISMSAEGMTDLEILYSKADSLVQYSTVPTLRYCTARRTVQYSTYLEILYSKADSQ